MKTSRVGYIYMLPAYNQISCRSCGQYTQQTFHKIGYTTNDPNFRRQMVETDCPLEIGIPHVSVWDKSLEQFLHLQFSHRNTRGNSEWFVLEPDEVELAKYYMDNPPDYQFKKRTKRYRKRISRLSNSIDFSDL